MYKVFTNQKVIFLTKNIHNHKLPAEVEVFRPGNGIELLENILAFQDDERLKELVLVDDDYARLKRHFLEVFTLELAAGGIVRNKKNDILMIFRRGKWDLPKGKLEPKESISECALREVEEETGVNGLKIIGDAVISRHVFFHKKRGPVLKQTYWYDMTTDFDKELVAQIEEDITEVAWQGKKGLKEALQNTYPLIRDLIG